MVHPINAATNRYLDEESIAGPSSSTGLTESYDAPRNAIERIVLVDDNSNIRRLAQEILEELGYEVEAYENGLDALAAIIRDPQPISLLVTDYDMPELTGYELAQRVRAARPGIPILIASGWSEDSFMPEGDPLPFLQKPYSLRSLARKIREILDVATPAPPSGIARSQPDCCTYSI